MTQNIKTLIKFLGLIIPIISFGQSSFIIQGSKDEMLLERLEIKARVEGLNHSFVKPFSRKMVMQDVQYIDSLQRSKNRMAAFITPIDKHNIQRFYQNNVEWANPAFIQKSSSFSQRANMAEVNNKNFFLAVNPALQYSHSFDDGSKDAVYKAAVGITGRGLIHKKIGFNFYFTGNRERAPQYVRQWIAKYDAVPGAPAFNYIDSNAVQYFDFRGSVQWNVAKFIDMQVGYDRQFLGNGIRSLWLSDFSGNNLFFKLKTRIWKLNFESLYMQLVPQTGIANRTEKKYLRINTYSINATKWLNIGLFDAVVLGRSNQFELNYILPLTFLRAMEGASGSPDNALLGLNIKANIKGKAQVYGQLVLDEFKLGEIRARRGWWANKFGYQLGAKYIDAFNINNLDIQVETNRARPFTYTHFDSISNYSHFNQPLAHQLGANFQEYIIAVRYQPTKKWLLQSRFVFYKQGVDSLGLDMGSNILRDYKDRPRDYGWKVGSGNQATCTYFSINGTYELMENFFLDASYVLRNYKTELEGSKNAGIFSVGFRWNISRREFDF